MEDDNGLELSLGLSCGGSSGKSKIKDCQLDPKVDEGSSNILDDGVNMAVSDPSFKNFFQTGSENQVQKGKQKSAPDMQKHENFWTDLGKCSGSVADHSNDVQNEFSQFNRYQELWASDNRTADTEDEKSNKRKMPFEDRNFQNKHEKGVDSADTHGKNPTGVCLTRNSHVSVATEDASSGVNEDVAESEAEGSSSWLVSQREEKQKSSEIPKFTDKHVLSDLSRTVPHQKESSAPGNEPNHELRKPAYGIPLSLQPLNVMSEPYPVSAKIPTTTNFPNASIFPSPHVMQLMSASNSERSAAKTTNTSNLQLSFGYSSVQLPTLETGSSWAFSSQPHHVSRDGTPSTAPSGDAPTSHAPVQAPRHSAGTIYEGKSVDSVKGNGKHVGEVSSSHNEGEGKVSFTIFRPTEMANRQAAGEEGCIIRPGIAASDVKFGGCGSYPDLPWVSTTGTGPNGKTISGVTYKFSQNEVKIVCACHGTHMSPEEFVQHASEDTSDNNAAVLESFPGSNPETSAKS